MKFDVNEGFFDRMLRAVIGLILFYLGVAGIVQGIVGIVLALLGAYLLLSAAFGFCLIYKLLNIHTN